MQELLRGTQTEFWAVNMGKPPAYDPVSETEYLVHADLKMPKPTRPCFLASTYDPARDRVVPGLDLGATDPEFRAAACAGGVSPEPSW